MSCMFRIQNRVTYFCLLFFLPFLQAFGNQQIGTAFVVFQCPSFSASICRLCQPVAEWCLTYSKGKTLVNNSKCHDLGDHASRFRKCLPAYDEIIRLEPIPIFEGTQALSLDLSVSESSRLQRKTLSHLQYRLFPDLKPVSNNGEIVWSTVRGESIKGPKLITLKAAIQCSAHRYGPFCRTKCVALNNIQCDTHGHQSCLIGWSGPLCDVREPCAALTCDTNTSRCEEVDGVAKCLPINPCADSRCSNDTICVQPPCEEHGELAEIFTKEPGQLKQEINSTGNRIAFVYIAVIFVIITLLLAFSLFLLLFFIRRRRSQMHQESSGPDGYYEPIDIDGGYDYDDLDDVSTDYEVPGPVYSHFLTDRGEGGSGCAAPKDNLPSPTRTTVRFFRPNHLTSSFQSASHQG